MNYNSILHDTCMEMIADACNHHYIGIGMYSFHGREVYSLPFLAAFVWFRVLKPAAKGSVGRISIRVNGSLQPRKLTCNLKMSKIGTETSYHIQTIHLEGFKLVSVCGLKIACAQNSFGFLHGQRRIPNKRSFQGTNLAKVAATVISQRGYTFNTEYGWVVVGEHYWEASTCCISLFLNGLLETLKNHRYSSLGCKRYLPMNECNARWLALQRWKTV